MVHSNLVQLTLINFTMKPASIFVSAVAALVLLLLLAPASDAAVTCSDVIKDLRSCVNYLRKGSGMPPSACCAGASALAAAAQTTPDKKAACTCIKTSSKALNLNPQLTKALPANCGISLPFPVTPNVDCTKIN